MKKKKLKLSLKKEVISNLQAKTITGGGMSEPMCPRTWNCSNYCEPHTMTCCDWSCTCPTE